MHRPQYSDVEYLLMKGQRAPPRSVRHNFALQRRAEHVVERDVSQEIASGSNSVRDVPAFRLAGHGIGSVTVST